MVIPQLYYSNKWLIPKLIIIILYLILKVKILLKHVSYLFFSTDPLYLNKFLSILNIKDDGPT